MSKELIAEPKWQHRSFFDEVDAMVPPWQSSVHVTAYGDNDQGAVLYPTSEPSQREIATLAYENATGDPRRAEVTMPFQAYVRAMDRAGNIHPLTVKTCQIAAEDQTGFQQSIIARKVAAGWLICERDHLMANGLKGEPYGEHLRAEWLRRRREHAARMLAQEDIYASRVKRDAEEERKLQGEALQQHAQLSRDLVRDMVSDMVPAIAEAVAKGLAAQSNPSGSRKGSGGA